jgi:hypothetical protein
MLVGAAAVMMNEKDFNAYLNDLEGAGMAITKSWNGIWPENIKYFFGSQLAGKQQKKGWDWVVVNYILPAAIQEISKLSKNHAQVLAHPWEASDAEFAEAWRSVLQWQWEKGINGHGMRLEQIASNLDKKLYGYSVSKIFWDNRVEWDAQNKKWIGDVKYRLWKPELFWSLGEEKIDDGACGTLRYVEEDYAVRRWPKFKDKIKDQSHTYKDLLEGGGGSAIIGQTSTSGTYPSSGTGGVDRGIGSDVFKKLLNLIQSRKDRTPIDEKTRFIKLAEIYFRDYEERHVKEDVPPEELIQAGLVVPQNGMFFDRETGQPIEQWPQREYDEPQYPMGRFVIRLGQDIVVNKNQRYGYKKWPFVISPHYLLPHMWQGWDAVQMYKSAQDMINISVTHLVNNMKMYGDPKVLVERGAIDSPPGKRAAHYKIGKGAGSIIRLVKGAISSKRFEIVNPPAPSKAATELYAIFAQEFKNIVGLQDIAQGKKTEGRMTATQSHFLMISANDRIALQSAYEDVWVTEVARKIAEICQNNYDVGRFVRIIGEDNVVGAQQISQGMKDVSFDIDIIPGSQLPFDQEKKEAKYIQAYQLLQDPAPNPMLPEVLRVMEITNWRKILSEHAVWQKFVQFLKLFQAVTEQRITLEQGLQLLVQAAREHFDQQQNTVEAIEAKNIEKEKVDQGKERLIKEGEAEGRKKERAIQSEKDKVRKEKEAKKK